MSSCNDIQNAKKCQSFFCRLCNFTCSKQSNYNKHLSTRKHIIMSIDDNKMPQTAKSYICSCGKKYKYRQGLSTHKKKCNKEKG